jgi:hypothetical protein
VRAAVGRLVEAVRERLHERRTENGFNHRHDDIPRMQRAVVTVRAVGQLAQLPVDKTIFRPRGLLRES